MDRPTASGWDTVVAISESPDRVRLVQFIATQAPDGWRPSQADVEDVEAVADGSQSFDSCARRLTNRWGELSADAEASGLAGATSTATSAIAATRARWLVGRSRDAKLILERIRKVPTADASDWLKRTARETLEKSGPNGKSGALGQFRGHLFEHLDVQSYNLGNCDGAGHYDCGITRTRRATTPAALSAADSREVFSTS